MECKLVKSMFSVIRAFHLEESGARDYGGGVPLYHAEVNLLDVIDRNPEYSAGELAAELGITKGALAQTAKRLIEKGVIEAYSPPGNRRVKYHRLTELGKVIRQGHADYHRQSNGKMQAYLSTISASDKAVLTNFFDKLLACMPICLYDCENPDCMCNLPDHAPTKAIGGHTSC